MHLRTEDPPICGRDHLAYRSLYNPVKNIVDGDLCETFNSLDSKKKREIAAELDRTPGLPCAAMWYIRSPLTFNVDFSSYPSQRKWPSVSKTFATALPFSRALHSCFLRCPNLKKRLSVRV